MGNDGGSTTVGFGGVAAPAFSAPPDASAFARPQGEYKHAAPIDITSLVKKRAKLEPVAPALATSASAPTPAPALASAPAPTKASSTVETDDDTRAKQILLDAPPPPDDDDAELGAE